MCVKVPRRVRFGGVIFNALEGGLSRMSVAMSAPLGYLTTTSRSRRRRNGALGIPISIVDHRAQHSSTLSTAPSLLGPFLNMQVAEGAFCA